MRVVVYCVFVLCMFLFRFELQCTAARAHVEAESTPARPRLTDPLSAPTIRPSLPLLTVCFYCYNVQQSHTQTHVITPCVCLFCGAHALGSWTRRNAFYVIKAERI